MRVVCVCVRERETDRQTDRQRQGQKETEAQRETEFCVYSDKHEKNITTIRSLD